MMMEWLKISLAFFFPVITACLYFLGMRFYNAYLEYWQVQQGMFPVDIAYGMTQGAFVLTHFTVQFFVSITFVLVATFGAIISLSYLADYIDKHLILRGVIPTKEETMGNVADDTISDPHFKRKKERALLLNWFSYLIGVCIFLLMFAFFIDVMNGFSKRLGDEVAENQKKEFDLLLSGSKTENASSFPEIHEFHLNDGLPFRGGVISCSDVLCAVYKGSGQRVIVKISDIKEMKASYQK